jgi:amino acid transporter
VLFERLTANWYLAGFPLGRQVVTLTLITEGALLFVAAQTGFVGGPQVLATMARDRWVPRRFSYLSERLVTEDGVVAMGLAAILILIGTHARVGELVILYAINVFVTFTLSQLVMSKLWWKRRQQDPKWIASWSSMAPVVSLAP